MNFNINMKSAIKTLEDTIHALKVEQRVWQDTRNFNAKIINEIRIEIQEHQNAIELLTKNPHTMKTNYQKHVQEQHRFGIAKGAILALGITLAVYILMHL